MPKEKDMRDIKVDETLWASSMLPEGVVERWFITNGATIGTGERIEPGSILATLDDGRPELLLRADR